MDRLRGRTKALYGTRHRVQSCDGQGMGKAERKITKVVTDEGILLYRRVTEVIMPNGKRRYPVDYFDATPGVVKVSKAERHKLSIPVYDKII